MNITIFTIVASIKRYVKMPKFLMQKILSMIDTLYYTFPIEQVRKNLYFIENITQKAILCAHENHTYCIDFTGTPEDYKYYFSHCLDTNANYYYHKLRNNHNKYNKYVAEIGDINVLQSISITFMDDETELDLLEGACISGISKIIEYALLYISDNIAFKERQKIAFKSKNKNAAIFFTPATEFNIACMQDNLETVIELFNDNNKDLIYIGLSLAHIYGSSKVIKFLNNNGFTRCYCCEN